MDSRPDRRPKAQAAGRGSEDAGAHSLSGLIRVIALTSNELYKNVFPVRLADLSYISLLKTKEAVCKFSMLEEIPVCRENGKCGQPRSGPNGLTWGCPMRKYSCRVVVEQGMHVYLPIGALLCQFTVSVVFFSALPFSYAVAGTLAVGAINWVGALRLNVQQTMSTAIIDQVLDRQDQIGGVNIRMLIVDLVFFWVGQLVLIAFAALLGSRLRWAFEALEARFLIQ